MDGPWSKVVHCIGNKMLFGTGKDPRPKDPHHTLLSGGGLQRDGGG